MPVKKKKQNRTAHLQHNNICPEKCMWHFIFRCVIVVDYNENKVK